MRFWIPVAVILGSALAHPTIEERDFQTVHLIFHAGPASYEMAFPADGLAHPTNSDLSVNIIDAPDFYAQQCTFNTAQEKTLVFGLSHDAQPFGQVIVGPPQPIISVSCVGTCVYTYGDCYNSQGQYVGPCCNGFCAANKCRPWRAF